MEIAKCPKTNDGDKIIGVNLLDIMFDKMKDDSGNPNPLWEKFETEKTEITENLKLPHIIDYMDFPAIQTFVRSFGKYPSQFVYSGSYKYIEVVNRIKEIEKTFYTEISTSIIKNLEKTTGVTSFFEYSRNGVSSIKKEEKNGAKYERMDKTVFSCFGIPNVNAIFYLNISSPTFLFTETEKDRIYCEENDIKTIGVTVFYDGESTSYTEIKEILQKEVLTIPEFIPENREKDNTSGDIYILSTDSQGKFITIKNTIKIPELEIETNYNEDFKEIHNIIANKLNVENSKGLVLLHGIPGTGKTTYIRYLLNKVNKKFIFIPPNLTNHISDPNFISFFLDNRNCILIIEDAENILKKRSDGSSQSISNILNLSDGLLADCLNIQIIATFNTNISEIDEALLRKGRLIAEYEFKSLTNDRIKKLKEKLQIAEEGEAKTLSEIYNIYDKSFLKEKKKLGF